MKAIRIQLTGNVPPGRRIWYQVHVQDLGWMYWLSDGEVAGTMRQGRRIEAMRIQMDQP